MAETPARRRNNGLLRRFERPALIYLAARMPPWATPDLLTGTGFIGAVIAFAGYALARLHPGWLLLATVGLAVNWFGDSLDGTLARARGIERPRYGYYLDNAIDGLAALLLAAGIALSGYVRPEVCFLGLSAYTMLSALTFLGASASGVFQISYAAIGPTETRAAFAVLNVLMIVIPPAPFSLFGAAFKYTDVLSLAWSVLMLATYVACMMMQARELAAAEPPRAGVNFRRADAPTPLDFEPAQPSAS